MPGPSLTLSARFPLISTIDVVRPPLTFHRESLPTVVRSSRSGDWARLTLARQERATAMRHVARTGFIVLIMCPYRVECGDATRADGLRTRLDLGVVAGGEQY